MRNYIITTFLSLVLASICTTAAEPNGRQVDRPNVVFIFINDLNDWIGCLDGHPDAITPNIDRLAERGVLFSNAHCAAPAKSLPSVVRRETQSRHHIHR